MRAVPLPYAVPSPAALPASRGTPPARRLFPFLPQRPKQQAKPWRRRKAISRPRPNELGKSLNVWTRPIPEPLAHCITATPGSCWSRQFFRKYPTPQAFAALKPEQLEPDIRSTGFFRNKSKSLVGAAKKLVTDFAGQVPDEMDKLLSLPGVARKTANVVLGTWFRKAEGVVVDTHVYRIARRLELTRADNPAAIEQD